jgi:hypothetical protein
VIVLVLGVVMAMGMCVPCAVSMYVFVLVEDDFEVPVERVGDAAECFQAGNMIAAFQTRNHRLGHSEPSRQLLLGRAIMSTQLQELGRTLCGNRGAVV